MCRVYQKTYGWATRVFFVCMFPAGVTLRVHTAFFLILCNLLSWGGRNPAACKLEVESPHSLAICKLCGLRKFADGCQLCHLKTNIFADGKIKFCHLSGMIFADGQRRTCRRQIFSLPSANENFADCKCLAGRRQNSYRINGKFFISHRQIC